MMRNNQTEHGRKVLAGHGIDPVGDAVQPRKVQEEADQDAENHNATAGEHQNNLPNFAEDVVSQGWPNQNGTMVGQATRAALLPSVGILNTAQIAGSKAIAVIQWMR